MAKPRKQRILNPAPHLVKNEFSPSLQSAASFVHQPTELIIIDLQPKHSSVQFHFRTSASVKKKKQQQQQQKKKHMHEQQLIISVNIR